MELNLSTPFSPQLSNPVAREIVYGGSIKTRLTDLSDTRGKKSKQDSLFKTIDIWLPQGIMIPHQYIDVD